MMTVSLKGGRDGALIFFLVNIGASLFKSKRWPDARECRAEATADCLQRKIQKRWEAVLGMTTERVNLSRRTGGMRRFHLVGGTNI